MMKIFLLTLLLVTGNIRVYASEISKMYSELRKYLNHEGAIILLAQAKHESSCGRKGVARKNNYNWWNVTCIRGGKIRFERENGRLVKKQWYVWETHGEAAREFVAYLEQKHPEALKRVTEGDIEGYVRILKRNGYFSDGEASYKRGIKRNLRLGVGEL